MKGTVCGNYFLLGRLATGGTAEVFLAKSLDPARTDVLLAVKRMLPQLSEDPELVTMFGDEARIACGLEHPNICRILDQGEHEARLYLVMEFIHGKDLKVVHRRARARGEPPPYRVIAYVLAKIAGALEHAHSKTNAAGQPEGIVHRDVSPQNILISYDGVPKLIDFGIAKAKHRAAQTRAGVVKGRFAYMSPEQATGQPLDARSDVFSLGIVLYEMVTGTVPFVGTGDLSMLELIARAEYTPPRQIDAELPRRLALVIERAMARDPADRYASARDMAADLHAHLGDEDRDVNGTVLSSYMRRLFREDYIREMARIRSFVAVEPPGAATPHPAVEPKRELPDAADEPTQSSSQCLAAGYADDNTEPLEPSTSGEFTVRLAPPTAPGELAEPTRRTEPPVRADARPSSGLRITILILALALGAASVAGTWWYASTMPLETSPPAAQGEPGRDSYLP